MKILRTLRWRLLAAFFAAILTSALVTGGLTLVGLRRAFLEEKSTSLLMSANIAANAVRPLLGRASGEELQALARRQGEQLGARVLVFNWRGEVVADQYGQLDGQVPGHPDVQEALAGRSGTSVRQLDDGGVLYAAVPVFSGLELTGAVLLAFDLVPLETSLRTMARRLVLASFAGGLLAAMGGYALAVHFTRPLSGLARSARLLADGNLGTRAQEQGTSELVEVAQAFNHMARRLEHEDRLRSLFIGNAAHELRSPLASMKVLAQAVLEDPGADISLHREFLRDIDREVDRLSALSDALLDLIRYQQRDRLKTHPVLVREAVHTALDRVHTMAQARGLALEVDVPPGLAWELEPSWFATLVYNLLHNAVKHAPSPGGQVQVRARVEGGRLVVEVEDNGEGIPPEHLPHVFERFYRVDKARARNTGGVGLGLAIVREIAAAHGGQVGVQSHPGSTVFRAVFPPRHVP